MTARDDKQATGREEQDAADVKDANECMAIGAGIGVLGAVSAMSIGAVCPVCYIAAPALIGTGLLKRAVVRRRRWKRSDAVEK